MTGLQLRHLFIGKAQATNPCGFTMSRVVATPSKCPPQNGRNLPKRWEKWLSWSRSSKNIMRKSTGGKICVIFLGGRRNFREYFRKHHEEKIKRVNFTNQLIFVDDPQDHGMKFGKIRVNSVNRVHSKMYLKHCTFHSGKSLVQDFLAMQSWKTEPF